MPAEKTSHALHKLAEEQAKTIEGFLDRLDKLYLRLLDQTQQGEQGEFLEPLPEWESEFGAYRQVTADLFQSGKLLPDA